MKKFSSFLTERYKNAIGPDDPLKQQYAIHVWELLQRSYAKIGGIKGSGFESPEDMIRKIPFWKMAVNNGTVEAVILYKDKGGRKSVAVGSTGSDYARRKLTDMIKNDIQRAFGEKSKGALGFALKMFPPDIIEPYMLNPAQVQQITGEPVTPLAMLDRSEWPEDARLTIAKFPYVKKYGYVREIGGAPTFKVAIGTPGMTIR